MYIFGYQKTKRAQNLSATIGYIATVGQPQQVLNEKLLSDNFIQKKMNMKNKISHVGMAFCLSILFSAFSHRSACGIKTIEHLQEIVDKYECDSASRELYYSYLINSCFQLQDIPDSMAIDYSQLFVLPSFISIGDELFSEGFIADSPSEYSDDYMYDYRLNYLYLCNNEETLRQFAGLFLHEKNSDGLLGLWGKLGLSLLPEYQQYLYDLISSKDFDNLYILTIFAKNSHNMAHFKTLINVLKLLNAPAREFEEFNHYVNQSDYITYEDYIVNVQNNI